LASELYWYGCELDLLEFCLWEDKMTQARTNRRYQIARVLGLVGLLWMALASVGCGVAGSGSNGQQNGDPLHLGVNPGPLGSTDPSTIQVRIGSEPSDRMVSLSLTTNSLKVANSGNQELELLTAPITVEFTHSAIATEPVFVRQIYQDTYSNLKFADMTGQVVFYDINGRLATQSLSVPAQTVPYTFTLDTNPMVLNISLDLAQTFTIVDLPAVSQFPGGIGPYANSGGTSSVVVNPMVTTEAHQVPDPAVDRPEAGSISFLVGNVTSVDTGTKLITIEPASGNAFQLAYDDATQFVNVDLTWMTGKIVEIHGATQADGSVLAAKVELVGDSQSDSELYGVLSGYAPDGMYFNLIVDGGIGVNVTPGFIGKNVTADWLSASCSQNRGNLDPSVFSDLVFDETRIYPMQLVVVEWDTLLVPDPYSSNDGYMQVGMFELEEQTLSGQVTGYAYDDQTQTGTFTLNVASNSAMRAMNPGLTSITVRMIPQTYLRNNPTFNDTDTVKVRGLLFADPKSDNTHYQPGDPVAFIMVADRISK
jgi:uncharacterized protein DUF5666